MLQPEAVPSPPRPAHLSGLPGRMIRFAFVSVSRLAPGVKPALQRGLIRAGYGLMSRSFRSGADLTFLNFGYAAADDSTPMIALGPEDQADKYAIQLYDRVAGARDLRGRDVLEVGSGRGGGASFVYRYLGPRTVTGVDFAPAAVEFCQRRHQLAGLTFLEGNAEDLPFPPASFDAVLNVESSHCYPLFERFLQEVSRVLRPGGVFLFADLRPRDRVAAARDQLARHFAIEEEENITANVFRALEEYSERRNAIIEERVPGPMRRAVRNLSAVEGTPTFEAFKRRELEYVRFVLRKQD